MKKLFNKNNPPIWGLLNIEQFEKLVDDESFPVCESCGSRIYNPEFYPENNPTGMCGPCTTGESETLMIHE